MKTQVNAINFLLKKSPEKVLRWKFLSQKFLEIDDIVDRTYEFD